MNGREGKLICGREKGRLMVGRRGSQCVRRRIRAGYALVGFGCLRVRGGGMLEVRCDAMDGMDKETEDTYQLISQ